MMFYGLSSIAMIAVLFAVFLVAPALAEEPKSTRQAVKDAIAKSLLLLEKGSAGSAQRRSCFTCHNQALPVLAFVEARNRGFKINEDNLKLQLKHTAAALERRKANHLKGRGKTIIDAFALWTLEAGGWTPDEITSAAAGFLLKTQRKRGHWSNPSGRPPSIGSDFTTTYVAVRGLTAFGTEALKPQIELRLKTVRRWLLDTSPKDTEDHVFRLRALRYLGADEEIIAKATQDLLGLQRKDGGWGQKSDMKCDAYATGTALVALHKSGGLQVKDEAYQQGMQFLLGNQLKDGSWHVKTRAKPFQTYFETGYPHGKDQFISIAAASWATMALLLDMPSTGKKDAPTR